MLDGLDRHLVAREARRELNAREVVHGGRHLVIAEIGTAETNAEVRRRGLQRELYFVARMKTDSDAGDLATNRALCVH